MFVYCKGSYITPLSYTHMGKKVNLYLDDDSLALWEQIPSGNRSGMIKQMLRDYTKSSSVNEQQQKIKRFETDINSLSAKRTKIEDEIAIKKDMLAKLRSGTNKLKIDKNEFWDFLVKKAKDAQKNQNIHHSYTGKSLYKIYSASNKKVNIENLRTGRTNSNFTKKTVELALQRLIDGGGKIPIGHFIPVKMHEYTVVALHPHLYEFDGHVHWSDVAVRPLTEDIIPDNRGDGFDGSKGVEYNDWEWIRVLVDNKPARCCTASPGWSVKIVIEWDEPNPRWPAHGQNTHAPAQFMTKYYYFDKPGKLTWGHDHEVMDILEFIQ